MPRLPRLYIRGAVYYITCRGESNQNIFKDEGDYNMFLDLLRKYKEQYGIKVFAFALMPTHLHLLIEMTKQLKSTEYNPAKPTELSDFMQNLNNSYTKYYNSRYERKGHLFRERFKAAIVEKEDYLLKMTAYIHLNPKKLNMAIALQDYPYSSYSLYTYNKGVHKSMDISAEIAEVFNLLGGQDYADFVGNMTKEMGDYIHKNLSRGGLLGSENFIKEIKSQVMAHHAKASAEILFPSANKHKLVLTAGGLVLVLMSGLGGLYFYIMNQKPEEIKVNPQVSQAKNTVTPPAASEPDKKIIEWKMEEWDIKLVPTSGGSESKDTLMFREGKFVSSSLNTKGFQGSNYTVSIEDNGHVVWETMQSTPNGFASWRGELKDGKMYGMLSLRQKGVAPQDFSFVSTEHRRNE